MSTPSRSTTLVLAAILIFPPTLAAQTTVSVRGGASISTLAGDDIEGASSRTGMNVGAAVTFGASAGLGFQVGGTFVQKGAKDTEDGVDIDFAYEYLEVPVLLRLGVPSVRAVSPHFVLGPVVSVELSCEVERSTQGVASSVKCDDTSAPIKLIDLGAMAGAGLDVATFRALSITVDVLYNLGLSTIDATGSANDVKNRAWSILAGVALRFG